ncbi:MAG: hypothetical protein IJ408_00985 [Clostridia bacterium]|nr:hypothetical protein [Clostridia bacterium]
MENLDKLANELKGMDADKRKQMLSKLSRDPKIMKQVSELMENPEFVKKLKDLLR